MSDDEQDSYCRVCGGCGVIGCCGIKDFLKKHVVGKTNCPNEAWFINDLLLMLEIEDDITGVEVVKGKDLSHE